jgi:hypothetical protein
LLFLSFVLGARTFFFLAARFFLTAGTSFFCSFFLSLFQQRHKDLGHNTLEQNDPQIYRIFRTAPRTNMGQSFGWQQG